MGHQQPTPFGREKMNQAKMEENMERMSKV